MAFSHQAIATSDSTAAPILLEALVEVQQLLQTFAETNGFGVGRLAPAFGTTVNSERLDELGEQFAEGDFRALPAIAPRPSQDLNGAMGVYVSETNQIYLSESLLLNGTQEQIVSVLLEEIGHGLDVQLNVTDSAGDEGAIFVALVQGQTLNGPQLAALQAENDQATLLLDGQQVTVEQAALTVNIAAQDVVDGTTSDITALLADPGADGLISLREAIEAANNTAGADTIDFDGAGTITLGGTELLISDDLTIDGDVDNDGTSDVTVDANQQSRVIRVEGPNDETVALDGLIITGGLVDREFGGGIFNSETLTITNSIIRDNTVESGTVVLIGSGGGIANANTGALTITRSIITGNSSGNDGGGIYATGNAANGATVTITDSWIYDNTATDNGGGIANSVFRGGAGPLPNASLVTITNSTISGNSATDGGGVSNFGQNGDNGAVMTITNSTISGNTATSTGGALYNRGQSSNYGATINVLNSTVTQNEVTNVVGRGGGIFNTGFFVVNAARIVVSNSIIAQNTASLDPAVHQDLPAANAPIDDQGNNLIDIDSQGLFTTSTLVGSTATPLDPRLDVLADNGGSTLTHGLFQDSPALNAGANPLNLTTDQRGFSRSISQTDIGALELQGESTVSILTSDATADENTASDTATYRISRTDEFIEALTVELELTLGTDLNFSDFTLSGGDSVVNTATNTATLTIPARQLFVDLTLTPNNDTIPEAAESLTLTLVDTADYTVDTSNNAATATIIANDPVVTPPPTPPVVTPAPTPSSDNQPPKGTIAPPPIRIRNTALNDIQITFDEAVTNFDLSDLQLTRNDSAVALTQGTLTSTDNVTWILDGISTLTTEDGDYEITLIDTTDVTDTAGNPLTTDTSITWQTGQTSRGRREIDFGSRKEGKTSKGSEQGERIIGTPLDDVLRGGDGNDRIIAGFGKDQFGRDRLFGGGGNDVMKAGAGNDFLNGGTGRDRLFGGKNDDELIGGDGKDLLNGGKGDDVLNGGLGRDRIKPGQGRDTLVYSALDEGIDTVVGFNPNQDLIDLSDIFSASEYAADNAFAQFVNYVQLEQIGSATHVTVDSDGSGTDTDFTTLAKLKGVQLDSLSSRNFVLE